MSNNGTLRKSKLIIGRKKEKDCLIDLIGASSRGNLNTGTVRRKTTVVYRNKRESRDMTPSSIVRDSSPADAENPGGEPGSAKRENLNTGTLRSLSRHKNLMYSAREAEMLEDIFKALAIHQPS